MDLKKHTELRRIPSRRSRDWDPIGRVPSRSCRILCRWSAAWDHGEAIRLSMFDLTVLVAVQRECGGFHHHFDKNPFFAKKETLRLRHREVLTPFRIFLQTRSVGLIRGQAVECDQRPSDIVGPFVREKIPDKMSAASRNDAAPILGVLLERISLEWIDLVAYDAHYPHWCPLP